MIRLISLLIALLAAAPAIAEDCELHFWGSDTAVTSNYSGVSGLVGSLLGGPSPQTEEGLVGDLSPEAQAAALVKLDLPGLLKMPGVGVVAERSAFPGKAGRKGPRATASTARCYAELVVDFIGYSSHITAGRKFGARFWLRRYPDGASIAEVQNGGKNVGLKLYPAKQPEDFDASLIELSEAFGKAAEGFLLNKVR